MSRYIVRTYKVPVPRELYYLCSELNRLSYVESTTKPYRWSKK
ncbi:hypothetical protein [Caldicellulosiruptor owensensis]